MNSEINNLLKKLEAAIIKDVAVDKLIDAVSGGNVIDPRKLREISVEVMQLGKEKEIVNDLRQEGATEGDINETVEATITAKLYIMSSKSDSPI